MNILQYYVDFGMQSHPYSHGYNFFLGVYKAMEFLYPLESLPLGMKTHEMGIKIHTP